MNNNVIERNEEVLYTQDSVVWVDKSDINGLKTRAEKNLKKKVRLCTHLTEKDSLHDMFIVHAKDTYIKPHKHINKSESLHVIEGSVDLVMLDDSGLIIGVTQMGEYSSGQSFYYRISDAYYHTLLISSDVLVFHESKTGPWTNADPIWAPWAPEQNDVAAAKEYMARLAKDVARFVSAVDR